MTLLQDRAPALGPVPIHQPLFELAGHGESIALHGAGGSVTYAELADRVADRARTLGGTRRLVLLEAANDVETVVTHLAALNHGHVVLLTAPGAPARQLTHAWDPDVVARGDQIAARRAGSTHDLHPDLALLLSTSGTTGSPKLVRLSRTNLTTNAASIADYLELTERDRAITSLPLHYCYGLSVLHSHLLVGAGLALSDLSVVDACFWALARDWGATSLAGVPYTFDLLERSGFTGEQLPSLRFITQAGGRLAPDRVRAWAERGAREGWDFVVMYGQTEATARMAWLPPARAQQSPGSIGIAVPGGSLRLDPVEGAAAGVGELVYSGPNVMMGYAEDGPDLARGPEIAELHTGDLAREVAGVWEVVGRLGRQTKLFGLRVDLDHLEQLVEDEVRTVVVDHVLHAFTTTPDSTDRLRGTLSNASGLPTSAIRVTTLVEMPRTASGKPDLAALAAHARAATPAREPEDDADRPVPEALRREFALVLGRPDARLEDTFVGLGGDSLSYVELATRLSHRLGDLPSHWHLRPIDELAALATRIDPDDPPARGRGVSVDTTILLRALAIVAIVASHADLINVMGGAHLLLAVAGHSFARFQLSHERRRDRLRHGLGSLAQVVVPSVVWIGVVAVLVGTYEPATALLLNGLLGQAVWTNEWQFWFLEALVWTTVAALALSAVPAFHRAESRAPFAVAIGLVLLALALRFGLVGLTAGPIERYSVGPVALWFALGWAACRADRTGQRWVVVALAVLGTVGFFGNPWREALIVGGIILLVLVPSIRLPRAALAPISRLASSSLFIYLTHWQVYPHIEPTSPLAATVASLAVGILLWHVTLPILTAIRPGPSAARSERYAAPRV